MKLYAKATLIALCLSATAQADPADFFVEGGVYALLATRQSFSISVSDQVTDGCLPQPLRLKDRLEVSLRKVGFDITDEVPFSNDLSITVLGYSTSSTTCAVSSYMSLSFPISVIAPFAQDISGGSTTFTRYDFTFNHVLMTGQKSDMQSRLEKWATDGGDELYLTISRARDETFQKFPSIKARFDQSQR